MKGKLTPMQYAAENPPSQTPKQKKRERFVAYDGRVTTFTKDGKRITRIAAARRIKETRK